MQVRVPNFYHCSSARHGAFLEIRTSARAVCESNVPTDVCTRARPSPQSSEYGILSSQGQIFTRFWPWTRFWPGLWSTVLQRFKVVPSSLGGKEQTAMTQQPVFDCAFASYSHSTEPLSSKYGTHKRVMIRLLPSLSGQGPSHLFKLFLFWSAAVAPNPLPQKRE